MSDKWKLFQGPTLSNVNNEFNKWMDEKPRTIKIMNRDHIAGKVDDGYPTPTHSNTLMEPPNPVGHRNPVYIIDVIYTEE